MNSVLRKLSEQNRIVIVSTSTLINPDIRFSLDKIKCFSNKSDIICLISISNIEFGVGVLSNSVLLIFPGAFLIERLLIMEVQSRRPFSFKEELDQIVPWGFFLKQFLKDMLELGYNNNLHSLLTLEQRKSQRLADSSISLLQIET